MVNESLGSLSSLCATNHSYTVSPLSRRELCYEGLSDGHDTSCQRPAIVGRGVAARCFARRSNRYVAPPAQVLVPRITRSNEKSLRMYLVSVLPGSLAA